MAELLIQKGVDVNILENYGFAILLLTIEKGKNEYISNVIHSVIHTQRANYTHNMKASTHIINLI